jgi:hypothetical protein
VVDKASAGGLRHPYASVDATSVLGEALRAPVRMVIVAAARWWWQAAARQPQPQLEPKVGYGKADRPIIGDQRTW